MVVASISTDVLFWDRGGGAGALSALPVVAPGWLPPRSPATQRCENSSVHCHTTVRIFRPHLGSLASSANTATGVLM